MARAASHLASIGRRTRPRRTLNVSYDDAYELFNAIAIMSSAPLLPMKTLLLQHSFSTGSRVLGILGSHKHAAEQAPCLEPGLVSWGSSSRQRFDGPIPTCCVNRPCHTPTMLTIVDRASCSCSWCDPLPLVNMNTSQMRCRSQQWMVRGTGG